MKLEQLIGEATEYDKKVMLEVKKPKSWLKSVSAFANGVGGVLIFGIADLFRTNIVSFHWNRNFHFLAFLLYAQCYIDICVRSEVFL